MKYLLAIMTICLAVATVKATDGEPSPSVNDEAIEESASLDSWSGFESTGAPEDAAGTEFDAPSPSELSVDDSEIALED